jgi:hypothetical protein
LFEPVLVEAPEELLDPDVVVPEVLDEPPGVSCVVVVLVEAVDAFELPHPTIVSGARASPAIAQYPFRFNCMHDLSAG